MSQLDYQRPAKELGGSELRMDSKGKIQEIPDFEDSSRFNDITPSIKTEIKKRMAYFYRLCELETGIKKPEEIMEKIQKAKKELKDYSYQIAEKMEACGIGGYARKRTSVELRSIFTKDKETLPNFRDSKFIPYTARQKRAKNVKLLEFYILQRTKKNDGGVGSHLREGRCRFWTFHRRARVTVDGVSERITFLFDKLKRLNDEPWFNRRFRLVFRSTELGSLTNNRGHTITNQHGSFRPGDSFRDNKGRWLFHPHIHLVVLQKGYCSPSEWETLRQRIRGYADWGFDDGGEIKTAQEACKYMIKPADLCKLDNNTFKRLYEVLDGRKLVQCYEPLQCYQRYLAETKQKIERPNRANDWQWDVVPNINASLAIKVKEPGNLDAYLSDDEAIEKLNRNASGDSTESGQTNQIIALLPPSAYFSSIQEPAVLVRNPDQNCDEVIANHPIIKKLRERCLDEYQAGVALAALSDDLIRLDTTAVTVGADENPKSASSSRACRTKSSLVGNGAKPPPKNQTKLIFQRESPKNAKSPVTCVNEAFPCGG